MTVALICILALLGSVSQALEGKDSWPEQCPVPGRYTDIPDGFWAKKAIADLTDLKIMDGFQDCTFRPNRIVSRAEMAALLVRAKGLKLEPAKEEMFEDVSSMSWSAPYVATVVKQGYMIGYPDRTFRPKGIVTRAEAAITIARAFGLKIEQCETSVFPDVPGNHWACDAIGACEKAGLLDYLGKKSFDPEGGLPRVEAAEIFSRIPVIKQKIEELRKSGG